ncbi:MAG: phosphate signaling complex protein PhoU [Pelotomaculum sp.]|uniref:Phosphate-specific transport system accessory protein PhoU n=1 Tax=Pelotomaculum thermopropionicum (strain DSM 13744 / JCM 10971 / SI) TaxID=370438 RepID=A5D1M0_PELTS|nr:phosphate signaling complex protein PhoU [Pelotomaculum sp.]BAF59857.1 phosphate uptake regulator [Pelotomaculum thermopropionicum SI]
MQNTILDNELEELKFEIIRMGALIEKAIYDSTKSLINGQVDLAQQVIAEDDKIDRLNVDVQDKCLRLLALRQPLAVDLRTVQGDLQIATDLERMGDCAEKIAKSTVRLAGKRTITELSCLSQMTEKVREMVASVINAYTTADIETARVIVKMEDEIDGLYRQCFDRLVEIIKKEPGKAEMAIQLLFAGHCLERIADHATNIGESILYMVTGRRTDLND